MLLYIACFLPFYTTFQIIVFNAFDNVLLVNLIKYSKDFVFFTSFVLFILGTRKSLLDTEIKLSFLDKLIACFLLLTFIYLIIPLGEAAFLSKIIYSKNIFLIGIVYFFGRKTRFHSKNWNSILKIIIGLTALSFIVAFIENIMGIHLHSLIGYADYNMRINDIDPQGNFGLNWSFERQGANPRFASFFADPLEFSASLLLFFSASLWYYLHSKLRNNKIIYLGLMFVVSCSFLLAFSRGAMLSAVLVLCFGLFISKNYKILFTGLSIVLIAFLYNLFFASEDTRYLIEDTLTFQNSSSLGHLLEWIQGLLSIYENPFGVGLAMSGNASGVDQSIKIGGENQFLIYGVQMGVIAVLLYLLIIVKSIVNSVITYKRNISDSHSSISFITACIKLGLIIPLFTANAELYLFVALFSWYLVGQVESIYLSKKS
ncbi:MAG: O-antigen ligase family protein [Bacteroidetes bacterium]|nr:O-antigen ligase family protein [Bacteroidota bacterium]MDA1019874.1 O-antigen ligase family protein [Bacteroidota bacterium]